MRSNSKVTRNTTFIEKLLIILEDQQCRPYIQWLESQNGFNITNVSGFSQNVLLAYFKHQNYSSFVRQLNMYGFSKVRGKDGNHVYEHRNFKRGSKSCIKKIHRKVTSEGGRREQELVLYRPGISMEYRNKQGQIQKLKERQVELEQKCVDLLQKNKQLLEQNEKISREIRQQQQKRQQLLSQIIAIISSKPKQPALTDCQTSRHQKQKQSQININININPLANANANTNTNMNMNSHSNADNELDMDIKLEDVPLNLLDPQEEFLKLEDFINVDYDQFSDIFKL